MLTNIKTYTDKVLLPVLKLVHKLTDKLSPKLKKVFCGVLILAWILVLIPTQLLKLIPLVGNLVLLAWCAGAVLVGVVVYDVWKSSMPTNAA